MCVCVASQVMGLGWLTSSLIAEYHGPIFVLAWMSLKVGNPSVALRGP